MDIDELKKVCVRLMERAEAAYLTTIGKDGYPCTRAMFNLRNKEQYPNQAHLFTEHQKDLMVYFATSTSSEKIRQLRANPRISVYYCDPAYTHGVMLGGDIEIVDSSATRHALWNDAWKIYFPDGPDSPDYTVLCLHPQIARGLYKSSGFELTL